VSQESQEEEYKVVKDLTQEVVKYSQKIYNFPTEVKIISAKLLIGPDGWGGSTYLVSLRYQVDGVEDYMRNEVHANINYVIRDMLFLIANLYERTHTIQQ